LHEAQVDRADYLASGLGEFEEWAVAQADLVLSPGSAALGRKPEIVEDLYEVVDRAVDA
jgi:hypothetical protein